jgi:uncharacterized membrane protein YphA (DoxX/SURF4 family)
MAIDRQAAGYTILRISIGTFFLFEGLGKFRWFGDPSILGGQLNEWLESVPRSSLSHAYLQRFAIPGVTYFARLVPLGEMTSGLAMILGAWTPFFALIAFLMALNFEFASGLIFRYSFLTNGYGFPVLGSTLALAVGAVRLPASVRGARSARATRAPRS